MSESQATGGEPGHSASGHSGFCPFCMAREAFAGLVREFGPPEKVVHHFRQAHLEILKGIRELVDCQIEKLSRSENKGTRIVVE